MFRALLIHIWRMSLVIHRFVIVLASDGPRFDNSYLMYDLLNSFISDTSGFERAIFCELLHGVCLKHTGPATCTLTDAFSNSLI